MVKKRTFQSSITFAVQLMNPRNISIQDYSYSLPENRIAQHPLSERDASKLLVYSNEEIVHASFRDLPRQLAPGDLLIFNDTRVIRARLVFHKPTGSRIELLVLDPANGLDPGNALQETGESQWLALIGNAKRWKNDQPLSLELTLNNRTVRLEVHKGEPEDDSYRVCFRWDSSDTFGDLLEAIGRMPLPPYMDREEEPDDAERYQTVYSRLPGSVAAPTAGLHFTQRVFADLEKIGVTIDWLTLHVGAGTFKPVKAATMEDHPMHRERIIVRKELIERLAEAAGRSRIISVGTTSMRTLESLYWFGRQLLSAPDTIPDEMTVGQWDPYEGHHDYPVKDSLRAILQFLERKGANQLTGHTQLLIAPGYRFRIVDGLVTNFHQPESTLLLLVSAFIGDDWKLIYEAALKNDYRFLSYGDSSLLWRKGENRELI